MADEINDAVIRIDPATGDRTILSSAKFAIGTGPDLSRPFGLVIDQSGQIYISDFGRNEILKVDPVTGNRFIASSFTFGIGTGPQLQLPLALAIENTGGLLVTATDLLRIDPASGNRTVVSSSLVGAGPDVVGINGSEGLTVDSAGLIYMTRTETPNGGGIFSIDPLTGDRALVSGIAGSLTRGTGPNFSSPRGITMDGLGRLLFVDIGLDAVVRVDPVTGDRTVVSNFSRGTGPSFDIPLGIAVVPAIQPVPEPISLATWSAIIFMAALARSRRRAS